MQAEYLASGCTLPLHSRMSVPHAWPPFHVVSDLYPDLIYVTVRGEKGSQLFRLNIPQYRRGPRSTWALSAQALLLQALKEPADKLHLMHGMGFSSLTTSCTQSQAEPWRWAVV